MDRSIYALLFLLLFVTVTGAALPPQDYWKSVLPNTPMPGAVRDLLQPDVRDEKATAVGVGKGGVHVEAGKGKPGTHVGVGGGRVHVSADQGMPGGTTVNVGSGVGVNVPGYPQKPPVVVNVPVDGRRFRYKYAATETQIHDDPNVALFFLEKDLYLSAKMNLHFTRTVPGAGFLPRSAANAIPFSSKALPEILSGFSIQPNSLEAHTLSKTLQDCEDPAAPGETRYCATSLESMVDFTTSSLGTRDVLAVSTEVGKQGTPKQQYTVSSSGVQKLAGTKAVACHAEPYAYAVFYCHVTRATKAYLVPLVGKDGTKVNAVAVCHTDTSQWNPRHLAFLVLKVKPGTVPVCHFLPQDHIVWALQH